MDSMDNVVTVVGGVDQGNTGAAAQINNDDDVADMDEDMADMDADMEEHQNNPPTDNIFDTEEFKTEQAA
jgi:ubiquitin-like-conjugating enzyme ATG3